MSTIIKMHYVRIILLKNKKLEDAEKKLWRNNERSAVVKRESKAADNPSFCTKVTTFYKV